MNQNNATGSVSVGTWVKVVEHGSTDAEVFQIVESSEANYLENKIPPDSLLGSALLGAKPGEEVTYKARNRTLRFAVLEVGRL